MLDSTLDLLIQGHFEWLSDDTIPKLRADAVQLKAENRRLKAELAELQGRYDDLSRWATFVAGAAPPPSTF